VIFVVKRCKKNILAEPLTPHYTASHSKSFLTFHHHCSDNRRPHNIEHSPSLALRTEFRSRNLSNTEKRWRAVDFDYVRTDGDWYRLCMTPYSLEVTVRLFCCHCQGRRCLILVPPLREQQIFQKCWDVSTKLYSALSLKTATYVRKTNQMYTFLNNLLQLNYPRHVWNKYSSSGGVLYRQLAVFHLAYL
jgi:hypothetical protein